MAKAIKASVSEKAIPAPIVEPQITTSQSRTLVVHLGESLPVGTVLTDEQYADLKGAGFTDERLFGA